ncbi:MAG: hypothetical protein L6R38_009734 [Xanthoria sp. 2 TBL-2021]|nr:MAG: hypothetical protein L6R38_009734 [Xanthoria sp. 2 TBL-2021]
MALDNCFPVSIVVHTASSIEPNLALHLITALGKRREVTGEETYFLHTSGLSAFYERTGWPAGKTKDTGPIFDVEKQLAESFPIRKIDVAVIEHAEACGVTSFIVVPSTIYGKGTGAWNRMSVVFPPYVQTSISLQRVYKFPENTKILRREAILSGTEGYCFALANDLFSWELLDQLAVALKTRGLITETETETWAGDEAAAKSLKVPVQFVQPLWNSG